MVLKKDKMNGIIQRAVTEILALEVKDPKIGFCTITAVDVTKDLSIAKIYVTFLGKGYNIKEGMEALNRSKGFIRSSLAKKLTVRKVPEIYFLQDTSLDYGNKIDAIIKEINK